MNLNVPRMFSYIVAPFVFSAHEDGEVMKSGMTFTIGIEDAFPFHLLL